MKNLLGENLGGLTRRSPIADFAHWMWVGNPWPWFRPTIGDVEADE